MDKDLRDAQILPARTIHKMTQLKLRIWQPMVSSTIKIVHALREILQIAQQETHKQPGRPQDTKAAAPPIPGMLAPQTTEIVLPNSVRQERRVSQEILITPNPELLAVKMISNPEPMHIWALKAA